MTNITATYDLCANYFHAQVNMFSKHDSFLDCHSAVRSIHLCAAPFCTALHQMIITAFHSHRYVSVERDARKRLLWRRFQASCALSAGSCYLKCYKLMENTGTVRYLLGVEAEV